MALIASENDQVREKCPAGQYSAVCIGVYDIGIQKLSYMGETKELHQCIICFELDERMKEGDNSGKRFVMSKTFTISLFEKANLRKTLETWRGKKFTEQELKGFDIEVLVNVPCMIQIMHEERNGKTYVNIQSISTLPKSMPKITAETAWQNPPKWIQKKQIEGDVRTEIVENEKSQQTTTKITNAQDTDMLDNIDDPHATANTMEIPF